MTLVEVAKRFLSGRAASYRRVFQRDSVDAKEVLADLAKFCRAHESTFHMNHACSDRLDGRREVFLRIQHHLKLTDDELWQIYGRKPNQPEGEMT